ncbi:MAG: peptidoglycan-binding protein [Ruminococcaceae bacterium]|nr:peptidoglycan-binding protein [Oscillospiraceae bacterium]
MTYQNDDVKQAIMQIQRFLRELEIFGEGNVTVPIDGIYGETTADAVSRFQRENSLPVTGTVDKATYDLLYEKALEAEFEQSEPLPLYVFLNGKSVARGEESDFVMFLQIILNTLTIAYDDFNLQKIDGVFDEEMENAIRLFQMRNNIAATGIVDKRTWNALVNNFNKYGLQNQ